MKNKKYQLPKVNKSLKAFLNEEEGKITKKNIQKIGSGLIVAGIAVSTLTTADSSLAQSCCSHTSHGSHSSHSSHSAHGSHGAW